MGLKNFFRKIWNGAKTGATKVWNGLKKGAEFVGRVAKPIANIASKAGSILGVLPGKVGLIGKGLALGGNVVKSITDQLPNSAAKEKINSAIDKAVDTGQRYVNRASEGIQRFNGITQPWINAGANISRTIGNGATQLAGRFNRISIPDQNQSIFK